MYGCAPVRLFRTVSARVAHLRPSIASFGRTSALVRTGVYSCAGTILRSILRRSCRNIVLAAYYSDVQHLCSALGDRFPSGFFFLLSVPHGFGSFTIALCRHRLGRVLARCRTFSKGALSLGHFISVVRGGTTLGGRRGAHVSTDTISRGKGKRGLGVKVVNTQYGGRVHRLLISHNTGLLFSLAYAKLTHSFSVARSRILRSCTTTLLGRVPYVHVLGTTGHRRFLSNFASHLSKVVCRAIGFYSSCSCRCTSFHRQLSLPVLLMRASSAERYTKRIQAHIRTFVRRLGIGGKLSLAKRGRVVGEGNSAICALKVSDNSASAGTMVLSRGERVGTFSIIHAKTGSSRDTSTTLTSILGGTKLSQRSVSLVMSANCNHIDVPFTSGGMARVDYRKGNTRLLFPGIRAVLSVNNRSDGTVQLGSGKRITSFIVGSGYTTKANHFLRVVTHSLRVDVSRLNPMSLQSGRGVRVDDVYDIFTRSRIVSLVTRGGRVTSVTRKVRGTVTKGTVSLLGHINLGPKCVVANNITGGPNIITILRRRLKRGLRVCRRPRVINTLNTTLCKLRRVLWAEGWFCGGGSNIGFFLWV